LLNLYKPLESIKQIAKYQFVGFDYCVMLLEISILVTIHGYASG